MEAPSSTSMSAVSSRSPFSVSYFISCRDSWRSSPRRDGCRSSPPSPFPLPSGSPSRFRSRGPTILAGRFWWGLQPRKRWRRSCSRAWSSGCGVGARADARPRPSPSLAVAGWSSVPSWPSTWRWCPEARADGPAHGWIVLLGFAAFEIFGLIHEILLPYVTGGLRSWRLGIRAHEILATLGLLLVLLSAGSAVEAFPRSSVILALVGFGFLLAMGVSVAVGTLRTVAAISRPVAAHRAAP